MKRGEIWIANLSSSTIGSEQGKLRPVLICQNNMGNLYSPTCTIIPLSSVLKKNNMPTHVVLHNTKCLTKLSIALAEQITTISKERFINCIGMINSIDLQNVNNAIMVQNGLVDGYDYDRKRQIVCV